MDTAFTWILLYINFALNNSFLAANHTLCLTLICDFETFWNTRGFSCYYSINTDPIAIFCCLHFFTIQLFTDVVKRTVETAGVQSECDHILPHCPQINTQLSLCTGIKLKQWETVPRFWCESIWNGQNVLCDELFVLLRQKVLLGGKHMQRSMRLLIIWEDFDKKLF